MVASSPLPTWPAAHKTCGHPAPQLGSQVPLGPPKEDGNRYNFDAAFSYNASAVIVGAVQGGPLGVTPLRRPHGCMMLTPGICLTESRVVHDL